MSTHSELIQPQQPFLIAKTIVPAYQAYLQWTVLLCVLFFCYPLTVHANNQENLKSLRNKIHVLQQDLTSNEGIKQEISVTLNKISQNIGTITARLAKLKEEDQKAIAEYRQFQNQYRQTKTAIELERDQLSQLLYQQYIEGKQDYLRLVLNQHNPYQIARATYYYQQFSLARFDSIEKLQSHQDKLKALIQDSLQKKAEIVAIQTEYNNQRKKLEQEKAEQRNLLAQISGKISKQQQEIDQLKKDEKRLSDLIIEINKAAKQKIPTNNGQALVNNKLPDVTSTTAPFPTLKGKLNLPVRGKLVSTFGGQRTGMQLTWKGLFIQSIEGSEVKAISAGKVVFADWLRGFGNLIILDHGNNYMSLYGNNATLKKRTGDSIRSGETIATVGNSSGNLDSGLYFELRHQGKPFDPLTWIKIE